MLSKLFLRRLRDHKIKKISLYEKIGCIQNSSEEIRLKAREIQVNVWLGGKRPNDKAQY